MMVLKYWRGDGTIAAGFTSTVPELLRAQIVEDDPDFGYVHEDVDRTLGELYEHYYVHEGVLVRKPVGQFVATPNPFPADGTSPCAVTIAPFVPCTLLVNREPCALTAADPVLILTSAVPHVFEIVLVPQGLLWAPPLLVEAR